LWLASVQDAFANKVVGWDSGPRATTELVVSALDYAIWSRDVRDRRLIHHSDKGLSIYVGAVPSDWSTPASRHRPVVSRIASIMLSPRTCGRP
jgi:transposase InsO family protein